MGQNEPVVGVVDPADQILIEWFDQLETLRTCAEEINPGDTPEDIPGFFKADPGIVLPDDMQKKDCGTQFEDLTSVPVPENAFAGANFRDVLGAILGPVQDCVTGVFEAVGKKLGTAPALSVKIWPTCAVYPPGTAEDTLCRRLADAMHGVFPKDPPKQTDIRNKLRTVGVTVQAAVDEIVKV